MDYRRLQTFRTVAALLSFSKAASVLNCSQSTISAQIRILEEELETTLFRRIGSSISLTKGGETYLVYADKILSIKNEAIAKVREVPSPPVTISIRMPQSISDHFLPRIIQRYHELFPHVSIDVSVCAFSELQAELKTGITDVAFLIADSITKNDFRVRYLSKVQLIFVSSSEFRPQWKNRIELEDLTTCTLFIPKHDCSYRMQLKQELLKNNLQPFAIVECNSMTMLKHCVRKGLGVALLPEFSVLNEIHNQAFIRLQNSTLQAESGVLMILNKNRWISAELRAFLDICEKEITIIQ